VLTFTNPSEIGFDQPSSARMLLGVIGYINDFNSREYDTMHAQIDAHNEVLQMFFNCKSSSVDEVLSKPSIGRKHSEVSFSQNFLDNLGFPME
jgi:hypothetical protein